MRVQCPVKVFVELPSPLSTDRNTAPLLDKVRLFPVFALMYCRDPKAPERTSIPERVKWRVRGSSSSG
jgi:hypothetical protein